MKLMKGLLILGLGLALAACGDDKTSSDTGSEATGQQETALEHAKKHTDPNYVCPMHPQIIRDEPGNCPICGMDLVEKEQDDASEDEGEKEILYYRHPHNPSITSKEPKKDEMGMDFVPVYDDGGGSSVKISPAVINNMGVRTAKAERDTLWRKIDTVGYVAYDESLISHIHLRTQGWIEKLYVEAEGERVEKGQLLYEVYAPELVNAQEEYVQALDSGRKSLIRASRERLVALGIGNEQIDKLRQTRQVSQYVKGYATQDGIVANLGVREGMYVKPQAEVMALADLSSVWIQAEVFESQVDWVEAGQPADVSLSYFPGRTWEGEVEYVYPSLNPKTRTLRVRLRFDNPDQTLKPNMFADISIYGGPKRDTVVIPQEALIRGGDEDRVILALEEGRFRPRTVVAGMASGDRVEIKHGLKAGERVVTSGQFLIDSEASLKASIKRMTSPADETAAESTSASSTITGTGVLHELEPEANSVNMSHDPIPAIDWPAMTMSFRVKPDVDLEPFSPDDKVEFDLEKGDDGYVIKAMRKRKE
ncbi:efflux RND transporter periplasmic adaptor subunit [Thiohalophilus sp.]|uniref:efflux RND transporter periplasmic adaptor subunit n=1 Tax=Thiohalophilus sp. TaxID=3028392 RepID=UPI002ACEF00A|nr:efflux RND transporter periplasmic adaptor subunit [Thiohalophilus sp.]MDZ7661920.1 efflux RND transporter periplasmic adaptor subunit [Thiohalophilus sp.]MDZ7803787.1 efflux RND transporter periplasmic adaptor subunit [Thiohalophilus sp.]